MYTPKIEKKSSIVQRRPAFWRIFIGQYTLAKSLICDRALSNSFDFVGYGKGRFVHCGPENVILLFLE